MAHPEFLDSADHSIYLLRTTVSGEVAGNGN